MTYPQYQQPQQQPYYPPQQPQYPAQGQPPMQQPPQAAPPQQYQQPMPASAPPAGFSAPPPAGQSYPRPKLSDLVGRLILIRPTAFDKDVQAPGNDPSKKQDRITADIVVLDGGPLAFGGSMQQGRPNTHQDPAMPVGYKGVFLSQKGIVAQLQGYLPSAQNPTGGRCLARVAMGTSSQPGHNRPYRLEDPSAQDIATATGYLQQEQTGALPYHSTAEPVPGQQPAMAGPPPGYPAPAGYPQGNLPGYPQQQPQYPPQPQPGQFPQYPPQQPGPAGYLGNPDPGAQYQPQQPPQPSAAPPQATPWG